MAPKYENPAVVQRRETLTVANMLAMRAASWLAADMAAAVASSTELGLGRRSSELVVGNPGAGDLEWELSE